MVLFSTLWLVASLGCQPSVSSAPLGYGPLSVAELTQQPDEQSSEAEPSAPGSPVPTSDSPKPATTEAAERALDASGSEELTAQGLPPSSGGEPGLERYAALFAGEDVAVFQLGPFPAREQEDPNARIRVEVSGNDKLVFVLINSENDEDLCTLMATLTEPGRAELEAEQPCFAPPDQEALQGTVTSGSAQFDGDELTLHATGRLHMTVGENELDGTLRYDFSGTRR